ncbi:MAG: hypothetical protein ACI4R9_06750 [Kiritimatiellia bacterium]
MQADNSEDPFPGGSRLEVAFATVAAFSDESDVSGTFNGDLSRGWVGKDSLSRLGQT